MVLRIRLANIYKGDELVACKVLTMSNGRIDFLPVGMSYKFGPLRQMLGVLGVFYGDEKAGVTQIVDGEIVSNGKKLLMMEDETRWRVIDSMGRMSFIPKEEGQKLYKENKALYIAMFETMPYAKFSDEEIEHFTSEFQTSMQRSIAVNNGLNFKYLEKQVQAFCDGCDKKRSTHVIDYLPLYRALFDSFANYDYAMSVMQEVDDTISLHDRELQSYTTVAAVKPDIFAPISTTYIKAARVYSPMGVLDKVILTDIHNNYKDSELEAGVITEEAAEIVVADTTILPEIRLCSRMAHIIDLSAMGQTVNTSAEVKIIVREWLNLRKIVVTANPNMKFDVSFERDCHASLSAALIDRKTAASRVKVVRK